MNRGNKEDKNAHEWMSLKVPTNRRLAIYHNFIPQGLEAGFTTVRVTQWFPSQCQAPDDIGSAPILGMWIISRGYTPTIGRGVLDGSEEPQLCNTLT